MLKSPILFAFGRDALVTAVIALLSLMCVAVLVSLIPITSGPGDFPSRLFLNLKTLVSLDFGRSLSGNVPVWEEVRAGASWTALLMAGAFLLMLLLATPISIISVFRPGSRWIATIEGLLRSLSSLPLLILAILSIAIVLKATGFLVTFSRLATAGPLETAAILLIPMLLLAIGDGMLADLMKTVKEETGRWLSAGYTTAARARGVRLSPHLFRSVTPPVMALVAGKLSYLLSGTIIVEYLFNIQGLGLRLWRAVEGDLDVPLVLAIALVLALAVTVFDVIGRGIAHMADPRMKQRT